MSVEFYVSVEVLVFLLLVPKGLGPFDICIVRIKGESQLMKKITQKLKNI